MKSKLLEQMQKRVMFLEGAMGTMIHEQELPLSDYNNLENCSEILSETRPDVIQGIHEGFLDAGADIVETNTFGGMPHVLQEFDLQDRVDELANASIEAARAAVKKHDSADKPRFVMGAIGPGTKLVTLGQISYPELEESYYQLAYALMKHGPGVSVDALLVETCQDLLQVKAVCNAVARAQQELGLWKTDNQIPIFVSVTIEQMGTMLVGSSINAALTALAPMPISNLGLNCGTGPKEMTEHLDELSQNAPEDLFLSVYPNAGLPTLVEGKTVFPMQPEALADQVADLVERCGLNMVGGCCGTTPDHIGEIAKKVGDRAPAERNPTVVPACSSLYQEVPYKQENALLNIGERCNASGSRKFRELLEQEDWDEMVSIARDQMKEGSHVLDVNVDYAGRDNAADMDHLVQLLVRQVDAPLMIDATSSAVMEAGLQHAGGKCLLNSANLEDGEAAFGEKCELARKYGAGLVLGCIDDDPEEGMARTADRKVEIGERMYTLATETYGLPPEDIMFDPLVLPISTGMEKDRESAHALIEGTKRIAEKFPETSITCGLSNVSFGLNPVARQVLNSAFLDELQKAGMTSAIVHVSKILPKAKVDEAQWSAALDLIYNRQPEQPVKLADGTETQDPLQIFIDQFPDDQAEMSMKQDLSELELEDRLQQYIVDGEKKGLTETLDEAMEKYKPIDIINDHLLGGMKVVGDLFGSGQMQLPFVLQSAEVMKMAVAHLEQFMEKTGESKGSIVLATVKGDVHDIGKNLVDIILTNNGYTVHNLGIKQPVDDILKAYEETQADAIGLSGLLVKSVNVMEENLREMVDRGINVPVLLGGAALARPYCEGHLRSIYKQNEGSVFHGKDAFEGLRIMDKIMDGKMGDLEQEIEDRLNKRADAEEKIAKAREKEEPADAEGGGGTATAEKVRSDVRRDVKIPKAPFYGTRIVEDIDPNHIYPFINKIALYRGQWGFKKGRMGDEEYQNFIKYEVDPVFDRLGRDCKEKGLINPKVVYGYFPVQSDGDDLIVYDAESSKDEIERFTFPRQEKKKRLCISDFFRDVDSGETDVLGLTCVTVGDKASEYAKELFESDQYQEYLYLHGFSVECAEGLAEFWHKRIRQEMGIDTEDSPNVQELFSQHYRGSRYSPGYPACPDMSDQGKIFELLDAERLGVQLTENWQIDPEQSTSAIVVHHPEAKYFNV